MNLTPLQLVLIAIVILFLCFLFKNLIEASLNQCTNRIQYVLEKNLCDESKTMGECKSCFDRQAKICHNQGDTGKQAVNDACQALVKPSPKTCQTWFDNNNCGKGYTSKESTTPCRKGNCTKQKCCKKDDCREVTQYFKGKDVQDFPSKYKKKMNKLKDDEKKSFSDCVNREDFLKKVGWTDLSLMFEDKQFKNYPYLDITQWDTGDVIDMSSMFSEAKNFNQKIGKWDTSSVTDMSYMFGDAESFNQPLKWDTSSVEDMIGMFSEAESFNKPLNWDTSSVENMYGMFDGATSFNQPLKWDTSSVENMYGMFDGATSFNQPLKWDTSSVEDMTLMFNGAKDFNQNIKDWDVSNVKYWYHFGNDSGISPENMPNFKF